MVPGITDIQHLVDDNIHPNAQGVYAPATPAALHNYFQAIAWNIAASYASTTVSRPTRNG